MKVVAIMATYGRHRCVERSLSLFLDQTYSKKQLLIYQNSPISQKLNKCVDKTLVKLINNSIDKNTGGPYTTLGSIYNDALKFVPDDTDVVTFWNDDDLFLEDHIEEGVRGLLRGGLSAYKPRWSYFRTAEGLKKWTMFSSLPSL